MNKSYYYSTSHDIAHMNAWVIIDTGATHHVSPDKYLFAQFHSLHNTHVDLPNGVAVNIAGLGTIELHNRLKLQNVLYIPQFRFHFLSISA